MASQEVLYKSIDGRFQAKFVEDAPNKLFEAIAKFQEVFEKHNQCGSCSNEEVFFNVRKVEKSKFYEKKCLKCGAALMYHSNEEGGGLYTTWKDKWEKYVPKPKDEKEEEVPAKRSNKK